MNRNHTKWYASDAGRINTLQDELLVSVFGFIPSVGRSDMNSLLRVSKRFNALASSDVLWSKSSQLNGNSYTSHWLDTMWLGQGKDGYEEVEWNKTREEAGLPIMNMLK